MLFMIQLPPSVAGLRCLQHPDPSSTVLFFTFALTRCSPFLGRSGHSASLLATTAVVGTATTATMLCCITGQAK